MFLQHTCCCYATLVERKRFVDAERSVEQKGEPYFLEGVDHDGERSLSLSLSLSFLVVSSVTVGSRET
jgi:hypothetical protein